MSRFRKVDAATWGDQRFRDLSNDGKLLWFYLLTGQEVTSLPGVLILGRASLAEALGWGMKRVEGAFAELAVTTPEHPLPMALADWKSRVVWLPNAPKHNRPTNLNVIVGWKDLWRCVPECALKTQIANHLRTYLSSWGDEYLIKFDSYSSPNAASNTPSNPGLIPGLTPHLTSRARAHAPAAPVTASALSSEGVQGEPPTETLRPPVPTARESSRPSFTRFEDPFWKQAYTDTVLEALGTTWGFPDKQLSGLRKAVEAHCPTPADVDGWLRAKVAIFVKAARSKPELWSAFGPDGFLRWLNAGCPTDLVRPPTTFGRSEKPVPALRELQPPSPPPDRRPARPVAASGDAAARPGAPPLPPTRPGANASVGPAATDPAPESART